MEIVAAAVSTREGAVLTERPRPRKGVVLCKALEAWAGIEPAYADLQSDA